MLNDKGSNINNKKFEKSSSNQKISFNNLKYELDKIMDANDKDKMEDNKNKEGA
jgi:hypothetical protein